MDPQEKSEKRREHQAVPAQYRRKRPVKKLAILIGLAVLVCAAIVLILWQPWNSAEQNPQNNTPSQPDKVIHLVAGGDINITDKSVAVTDYQKVFQDVLPILAAGDVTMLNLEGVVSGNTYGTATKSTPPELLAALKNAGVDVLQTANSYSIFDGLRGLNATLQGIKNAGMTPLGTYANNGEFEQSGGYIIWEIKGIKVAMMAFTKGMDGMGLPAGSENCVNLLYEDYNSTYQKVNEDGIRKVVQNAAAHNPDVMIAMVHWGSEFNDQISKSQKKICTILQEEGVSAIIGTHPHYVQKMEFDPASGSFVAWSLGDFYGDGEIAGTNYSVILDLEITMDGKTGKTKVTGFEYVPIFIEKDEEGQLRLLRIKEAMSGYENRYLERVSEETYNAMKTALERIKSRVGTE